MSGEKPTPSTGPWGNRLSLLVHAGLYAVVMGFALYLLCESEGERCAEKQEREQSAECRTRCDLAGLSGGTVRDGRCYCLTPLEGP